MLTQNKTEILYSFDIFDTLVTRKVALPRGIFAIVQQKLVKTDIPDFIKNNFYKIRAGAEDYARKNYKTIYNYSEVSFDNIYEYIKRNNNLTDVQVEFIKNLEISTEIENLVPIDGNIRKIRELLSADKKVVLISDMYYSADTLRFMLSHIDPVFEKIKIYSSADYKCSKSEGELYKIIEKEEDTNFAHWKHYGDNKISDIKRAKTLGICVGQVPYEELLPYEKYLLKHNEEDVSCHLMVGAAKLARMQKKILSNPDVYDFGASFAGPLLYGYVEWVLDQALSRGFKTLYFVARDGYIPKLIADIIIKKQNLPLKAKYIYGSRLAWRIPSEENFDDFVDTIFSEYIRFINIKFLAYRLSIEPKELAELLGAKLCTKKFNKKQRQYYANKFKTDPKVKKRFLEINNSRRELLKDYLKQEIDFEEKNIAFVDLYGSGKTIDYLSSVINEISDCKVYSLYYTNNYNVVSSKKSIKLSYFLSFDYYSFWIELLCRTFDGQTIGYERKSDGIVPILEKGIADKMEKWGYQDYIDGIKNYSNIVVDLPTNLRLSIRNLYTEYLQKNLDKKTADIIGDIPYASVGEETNVKKSAPKIHFIELLLNFVFCRNVVLDFPFISLARSSLLTKSFYKITKKYGTLRKFLFYINTSKSRRIAYVRILGLKISFRSLLWKKLT